MLLYFIFASISAVLIYLGLNYFSTQIIYERYSNPKAVTEQTEQELQNFIEYVAENRLSTSDTTAISDWIYSAKYVLMSVYKDKYLVFSNYLSNIKNPYGHSYIYQRLYDVEFLDGTAQVGIYTLAASKVSDTVQIIEMVIAILCFLAIILKLFSSKFKYISRLQSEMEVIGSGNLDLQLTIKGNDEITLLASGIDEMRKSFLERIKSEKEAKLANSELITSISHDLRTPLTILIGNLDVIINNKYKNQEQYERYIINCRNKAYQIKELSDKLFEYFLVNGSEFSQPKLELLDGCELFTQLIDESAMSLEERGFKINIKADIKPCLIKGNVIAIRRIIDNLFGNINKYARPYTAVDIALESTETELRISIKNQINAASVKPKGTNIGIATCEKIVKQHGGSFKIMVTDEDFNIIIGFPRVGP
jgi:signal transduction histidine kinase